MMQKSPAFLFGILLIVVGVSALAWQGITYTTRETVVDVGPLKVTADKQKTLPISPIVGGIAVAAGAALLATGRRSS